MRRALTAGIFVILTASGAGAVPGTPVYESSEPSKAEMVHQSVEEVSVTFNELLDPAAAELSVSACGADVDDDTVTVSGFTVEVGVVDHPVGNYTVSFSVSGADDTPDERENPTEGTFEFFYHSRTCEEEDPNDGHHGGHGDDKKDRHDQNHGNKKHGKKHGGHSDKPGGNHESEHTGHDASSHIDSSHTEHSDSEMHSSNHSSGTHGKDGHKKRHKEHQSKDHSNGSNKHQDTNGGGSAGSDTEKESPSRPNQWLNLSLVLLLPAALGALGGRRLRRLGLRPAG